MHLINWWSTIGLFLDIFGVILLFEYGLPSKIETETGRGISDTQEVEDEREKKNIHIKKMSYTGLSLIGIGFILQIIGSNVDFFVWLLH